MKISTIIFDFDGTIMNTNEVIMQSWQHTYMVLEGKERPRNEILKSFGEPLKLSMEKAFPNKDAEEAMSIYRGYQKNNFDDVVTVFDGIPELIKKLNKEGYKIGIVTSRTRESTIRGLENYELEKYILEIVSCEDTLKHKPDPEPMNIVLRRFGTKPENAIMIGDSRFDIQCAHNAGVKAVMVSWAEAMSLEDMKGSSKPDYILQEANDLFDII